MPASFQKRWPIQYCGPARFSAAAKRRSRCGSVRGRPLVSSHFFPGLAPQVGQWTARACSSLTFISRIMHCCSATRWSILTSPQVTFVEYSPEAHFSTVSSGDACGPSGKWTLVTPVLPKLRKNVATKQSVSQNGPGSRRPPSARTRRGFSGSSTIELEAIAAEPNRGNRELSSATVRNRNVHHGPVRGHIGGVWDCSIVGATRERHGTRI